MNWKTAADIVAKDLNLPVHVVQAAYKAFWEFVKKTIEALPLDEDLSEEEFMKLRTNFNIPSLGKLSCTYDRFVGVRKKWEYRDKKGKRCLELRK